MQINLLNEYFVNRSQDNNATRLVNWYLEIENPTVLKVYETGGLKGQQGKYKVIAIPTPGKTLASSAVSGNKVRGMITNQGIPYAVIDNTFYSFDNLGNATTLGTLTTSTGYIEIASIGTQIGIVDGSYIYIWDITNSTWTRVSDINAPQTPTYLTAQDGSFLCSNANSIKVQESNIGDGTNWTALTGLPSFANKQGAGDYIAKLISNERFIWVLGTQTSEIWYNTGSANFNFGPYPNAFIEYGCAASGSVAKGDNNIIFLAQSISGGIYIVMSNGLSLAPISNPAISYQMSLMSTVSDAIGYTYQTSGHMFYILTFPTGGKTFVYDVTQKLWHERQSTVSGIQQQDIGSSHCFAYGKNFIGDSNSGNIYYLDETNFTENGNSIQRTIVTPPAYNEGKKLYLDKLQIDTETGIGSNLTMNVNISYDSGYTFPIQFVGTIPQNGGRMFFRRIGFTQNAFCLQLQTTTNANIIVIGATAEVREGVN